MGYLGIQAGWSQRRELLKRYRIGLSGPARSLSPGGDTGSNPVGTARYDQFRGNGPIWILAELLSAWSGSAVGPQLTAESCPLLVGSAAEEIPAPENRQGQAGRQEAQRGHDDGVGRAEGLHRHEPQVHEGRCVDKPAG